MSENISMLMFAVSFIIVFAGGMFITSIYETYMQETTKRKAIEALKSNVELKITSADIKELFK